MLASIIAQLLTSRPFADLCNLCCYNGTCIRNILAPLDGATGKCGVMVSACVLHCGGRKSTVSASNAERVRRKQATPLLWPC